MGQTRTSLLGLQKILLESPAVFDQLLTSRKAAGTKISELANTAHNGWDLMFMHLSDKFKAQKQTVDTNANKTLKEVMDPGLAKLVAGLEGWRKDLADRAGKAGDDFKVGTATLAAQLAGAKMQADALKKVVEKKKGKLLASAKYKTKMRGYLESIAAVDALITTQTASMAKAKAMTFDAAWVNKWYTVKLDMTVADVKSAASMDVQGHMKTYLANQEQADAYVRGWRDEYKGMAGQLKAMGGWAAEADDMEAEGEEGGTKAEAKPDPKPEIKKIVIKMGSSEIGTAVTGEYDRATKLLTVPVVLWKKGTDPLGVLQKKMTIAGMYANAAEGKFTNDMKLDKVAGDMKKATFKGA